MSVLLPVLLPVQHVILDKKLTLTRLFVVSVLKILLLKNISARSVSSNQVHGILFMANWTNNNISVFQISNFLSTYLIFPKFSDPCPAGQYKSAEKTTCEVCKEGTVSTETGATSCTSCDPGKQANSDKTLCGECADSLENRWTLRRLTLSK